MSDDKYNGWSNYETWNLAIWIDSDEGTSSAWRARCQSHLDDTDDEKTLEERREEAAGTIADHLSEFVLGTPTVETLAGYEKDILIANLQAIDFEEITAAWMADMTPLGYEEPKPCRRRRRFRVFRTFEFYWDVDAKNAEEAIEATADVEVDWENSLVVDPTTVAEYDRAGNLGDKKD